MKTHDSVHIGSAGSGLHRSRLLDSASLANQGPVLVVIDMQPGYKASSDAITQWFVKQEISRARLENQLILIVEYHAHEMGETYPDIMKLVDGYERAVVVPKSGDDGSAEILRACAARGFSQTSFRMCGVNSDACVLESVQGLVDKEPGCSITVVQDACNCLTGRASDVWYEDFPAIPNVNVELHGQGH